MGSLYWLASYPKSGNTWTRVLLTNYLRNTDTPADINDLEGGPIASARSVFDDHVGIEASDLSQDEIERYRPYVYEYLSREHERRLAKYPQLPPPFLKVHDAYTYTTAGVIYLVRHPFDVAVSFAHHGNSTIKKTVAHMGDPSYSFVDNPGKLHNQLRQNLLTWSGHVKSWLEEPDLRVLVVRYEDLLADTQAEFSRMLRFVGLDDEGERVAKAVRFSSFSELQAQEAKSGFREKMPKAKSFFRSGTSSSWKDVLSEDLQAKLLADHSEVMQQLGYQTDFPVQPTQKEAALPD
jgi:aryl sulfotransferase